MVCSWYILLCCIKHWVKGWKSTSVLWYQCTFVLYYSGVTILDLLVWSFVLIMMMLQCICRSLYSKEAFYQKYLQSFNRADVKPSHENHHWLHIYPQVNKLCFTSKINKRKMQRGFCKTGVGIRDGSLHSLWQIKAELWDVHSRDKTDSDWRTYPNDTSVPVVLFCVTWLNGHRV